DGAAIGLGGTLVAAGAPGRPFAAWVERTPGDGPSFGARSSGVERIKGTSAVVAWSGEAATVELKGARPAMARIVSPCPAVARIAVAGRPDQVVVVGVGDAIDAWLPTGQGEVVVRAFAGATLGGRARVTVTAPVPIADGLGPEVLVGPDDAAWFSFRLDRAGAIGIGAHASAERVDAVLVDATGAELARGLVVMRELQPGEYLVGLSQRGGSGPVRVRPALAGVATPPSGPPDEVVRRYIELARGEGQ
ncbi:MAG: hypothetical protein ABMB14_36205, partial [Myxococcota bacterium]